MAHGALVHVHRGILAIVFAATALTGSVALAGDLYIGSKPFETDDAGRMTKAARDAATTTLEAEPGDDAWTLHLWAKIDNPAKGPLYLEFYRERAGKRLVAHRQEYLDYEGDPYVRFELEIWRSDGFRVGETVELAFVQNVGGKDVIKAKSTLTLAASSAPAPKAAATESPEDEEEQGEDEGEGEDAEAQPEAAAAEPTAPPPVDAQGKKGCRVGDSSATPGWALLTLLAVPRRRRR